MRNPVRLKNLRPRFLPYYASGLVLLLIAPPSSGPFGIGSGLALVLAGAGLRTWGAGHLVKNDVLATTGPYARVRDPLYTGTLLIAVGFALIAGGWVCAIVLLAFLPWFFFHYFPRKDRIESARLTERYGDVYASYRSQVPALVPAWGAWRSPDADAAGLESQRWQAKRFADNNEAGTLLALGVGIAVLLLRAAHAT